MHIFLTHLASVPPVHFLLSTIEVTQLPFHSIMVFNIRLCYHVLSFSCHVLSFNPTGLLAVTCGCNVQARFGRSIFSTRAKSCDATSSHLSRARVSSTVARVFYAKQLLHREVITYTEQACTQRGCCTEVLSHR